MQTKTTFTPGTLTVRDYPPGRAFASQIFSLNGLLVAHTYGPDHAALGKLFAAAPDLYAALDRVADTIHWMDSDDRDSIVPDGLHEAIRAALRRARGEG